jgi:hypothetical protein
MDQDTPDGTPEYGSHKIDYYIIGGRLHFDVLHFEALMGDIPGYVPAARGIMKLDAKSALNEASANGKQDFADYVKERYREFL